MLCFFDFDWVVNMLRLVKVEGNIGLVIEIIDISDIAG